MYIMERLQQVRPRGSTNSFQPSGCSKAGVEGVEAETVKPDWFRPRDRAGGLSGQAADLSEGVIFGVSYVERIGSTAESQALRPEERCFLIASIRQPGAAASDLVEEAAFKICDDDPVPPILNTIITSHMCKGSPSGLRAE